MTKDQINEDFKLFLLDYLPRIKKETPHEQIIQETWFAAANKYLEKSLD